MRIYIIDFFRFLASVMVVVYHYFSINQILVISPDLRNYFKYGYLGVDFFFILSGFLIALSITNKSIFNFLSSRIRRLYPTYWISVIITSFFIYFFGGHTLKINSFEQIVYNLTMFHNYFGIESIDGVYWTLFIELKFYLFIISPFLILKNFKILNLDNLIIFWLLLTILNNVFDSYFILIFKNYFILEWSSYFISGIIFYKLFKGEHKIKYYLLLIISYLLSIYKSTERIEFLESIHDFDYSELIVIMIISLFYLTLFLICLNKLSKFNLKIFKSLGLLSYPLYLLHQNIGFTIFLQLENHINKYLLIILTILFMLLISFIVYNLDFKFKFNFLKNKR